MSKLALNNQEKKKKLIKNILAMYKFNNAYVLNIIIILSKYDSELVVKLLI